MATLLILKTSGHVISKCGPYCYNSIFEECHCICRGSNHGQGYARALQNSFNNISRLKKSEPDLQLSLHSKKKLSKLVQLNFLPADD